MKDLEKKKEEYRKTLSKGQRWLMDCLLEIGGKSELSEDPDTEKEFFQIIKEEYRRRMREDESFYRAVEELCSKRRLKKEKRAFFNKVLDLFMRTPSFNRECMDRIEGYTRLPRKYRRYI